MKAKITHFTDELRVKLLDGLVKVFLDEEPAPPVGGPGLCALQNDRLSLQLALSGTGDGDAPGHYHVRFARLAVESLLAGHIAVRKVEQVPVRYPAHAKSDSNYLRKSPGLYPDLLAPLEDGGFAVPDGRWTALWIDVELPADCPPGTYPAAFRISDAQTGEALAAVEAEIEVLPFALPEQAFPRTEWFHADCLADWYGVPVFSEAHWAILKNYVAAAVKRGINTILTPQFTPPLDTAVGRERTTVQLVEVWKEQEGYRFDFARLRRWIDMCLSLGVKYFELSHLFSQWGAVAAPKVVGWEDGELKRLFGWDTPAVGGEYTRFLNAYLPQLRAVLRACGIEDRTFFHISDEPSQAQLDSYRAARESVREALAGCTFLEALSDYDFYRHGLIDRPVCATDRIGPFLEHRTPGLWSYYCTAQSGHASNCFIAQPSGCTRLYGAQLFKFGISGSLRWGFNFYNSADSYYKVNPYLVNDGDMTYPAGDAFLVYPGPEGQPLESIRLLLLDDAMRDLRALTALADKLGRERAVALMEEGLPEPLTFDVFPDYPEDAKWLLRMRERVNRALAE